MDISDEDIVYHWKTNAPCTGVNHYDGSQDTTWRTQCSRCPSETVWTMVDFGEEVIIACADAHGLGWGIGGDHCSLFRANSC